MPQAFRIAIACAAFAFASPAAFAETPPAGTPPDQTHATATPITTLVLIKTPAGTTRPMIDAGIKQSIPTYEKIPGLLRKYFIVNADSFGGMYLWTNRAAAEAWYTEAWRAKAKATYGIEPQLTYFDSPVQLDNIAKGEGQ